MKIVVSRQKGQECESIVNMTYMRKYRPNKTSSITDILSKYNNTRRLQVRENDYTP